MNNILAASLLAGFGTTVGAALALLGGRPGRKSLSFFLGCAAGIMAGVVFLDLIPSALSFGSPFFVAVGVLAGLFVLSGLDSLLGILLHSGRAAPRSFLRMGYLMAIGIALHDLPEGFAIAAGYAAPGELGPVIALAIGLHNIPEGMAIAVPLSVAGIRGRQIMGTTLLVSLFTPLGTLAGLFLISLSQAFIALLLALAGGAMLYLVGDELLPEAGRYSLPFALMGGLVGLVLIIFLNFWW